MKTLTLKKIAVMLFCIPFFAWNANAALTHGSAMGTGLAMYPQHNNLPAGTAVAGLTLDYKAVTIGSKSWAWTNIHGANIGGASYSSQFRYYTSTYGKTENNLVNRVKGSTTQTFGSTISSIPASPMYISFFQDANGFNETDFIPYDKTAKNSQVGGDVTAPTLASATGSNVTVTSVDLTMSASDDSGNLFYYITDGAGVSEVSFLPTITLTGLTPTTAYTLTITAIDFNGNESTTKTVNFTTGGLVQITSGIAQGVKFVLKSTATQLEFYYEPVDPAKKFRDTSLKITPAGGTQLGEIKPTISPDGSYAYAVTSDANIANKIISVNCGYWFAPGLPDYSDWVITNNTITSGPLTGTEIKHQMGGGISQTEAETTPPVLNSVTLSDVAAGYVKLNINGSDNSGTVYYTISGAKSTVNAFRTGDYYLTSIDPGKIYNLSVKAYDLSSNSSTAKTLKVKTMSARSNIKDSTNCNYNTLVLPAAPGGELTTIIQQSGSTLTLGCTTKSLLIPAGSRNKIFNNPTVKIDNVTYPLILGADGTTATATFNSPIGSKAITPGTSFQIQWNIYWGEAGVGGIASGGNFFTGVFTYVIGDNGQVDVTGPSTPLLTLTGNALTWPACTDDFSGVKSYLVSETGQTPFTIFDLGEVSFSYTMVNTAAVVSVKSIDFVGNQSVAASKNDTGTATNEVTLNANSIYPNPATNMIYISGEVSEVALYSLQGQLVRNFKNTNTVNVSTFAKGLYVVKVTDRLGNQKSSKLEIK